MCATKGCFYVGRFILALSPPVSDDVHRCPQKKKEDFPQGKPNGKPSQYIPNLPSAMISTIKNHCWLIIADFTGLPVTYKFDCCLVVYLPLWKIWKSVGIIVPHIWKHKKCPKPPTKWKGPSIRVSSAALNATWNHDNNSHSRKGHCSPIVSLVKNLELRAKRGYPVPLVAKDRPRKKHASFRVSRWTLDHLGIRVFKEIRYWLVVYLPLWKIWKSVFSYYSQYMESHWKKSKPPTRMRWASFQNGHSMSCHSNQVTPAGMIRTVSSSKLGKVVSIGVPFRRPFRWPDTTYINIYIYQTGDFPFSNSTAIVSIVYQRANPDPTTIPPLGFFFCRSSASLSIRALRSSGTPRLAARLLSVGSANASRWSTTAEPHGQRPRGSRTWSQLELLWVGHFVSLWHEIWQHIYGRAKQNPKPFDKNRQKCKQK